MSKMLDPYPDEQIGKTSVIKIIELTADDIIKIIRKQFLLNFDVKIEFLIKEDIDQDPDYTTYSLVGAKITQNSEN